MAVEIQSSLHFHTLASSTPFVIADFYASWCPPCKTIAPFYAQLAQTHSHPSRLLFVKINVDNNQELAAKYGVSAMPTFVVFEGGKKREGVVRGADVQSLKRVVEGVVAEVGKLGAVKEEKKEERIEKEEVPDKKESKDESTVSGSYGMTKGSGWRMKV